MIELLLVEDSSVETRALQNTLLTDPEILVTGTVRNGDEAVDFIRLGRPDAIAVCTAMPSRDGCKTIARILKSNPIPVVILLENRATSALKHAFEARDQRTVAVLNYPGASGAQSFAKDALRLVETVKSISETGLNSPSRQRGGHSKNLQQR